MKLNSYLVCCLIFLAPSLSMNAAVYRLLDSEKPDLGSPAAAYIEFLQAARDENITRMEELSHGNVLRFVEKQETRDSIIKNAKNIDWERPIKWAQKIEGEVGKVALNYYQKDDGKLFRAHIFMSLVDGDWKHGK